MFEQLADRSVLNLQHTRDGRVVFVGMADGLLEDGRVRRHPAQAVVIGELLQAALGDETAGQEIEPDGLAVIRKRLQRIHCREFLDVECFAICNSAAATTLSATKPNFCSTSLIGAEAPKLCMPMMAPRQPA